MKATPSLLSACLLTIGLLGTLPRLAHADSSFADSPAGKTPPSLSLPTALAVASGRHQGPPEQAFHGPGDHAGRPPLPFMPPPEVLPLPPFLHGIELSEAQQDQAFAIVHEQLPRLREQGKALRKAAEGLRTLVAAASFDEAKARELSREEARAAAELHLLMARTDSRLLALLTPPQRLLVEARRPGGKN